MIWDLPVTVDVQGTAYNIRTDYRCILDICTAITDPGLDNRDRVEAVLDIFYPDFGTMPPEHLQEAVERCFWFLNGGDRIAGRKAPKLVDWEQDYPLLIAPINRVLGKEIRAVEYLHWWTFLGAYQEIGDCTFAGSPYPGPSGAWKEAGEAGSRVVPAEPAAGRFQKQIHQHG